MDVSEKTGLPRFYPSVYGSDPNIKRRVTGLAKGRITAEKVDHLAQAVHKATGWAGRPVPWEEMSEGYRQQAREHARWTLQQAKTPEPAEEKEEVSDGPE